MVTLVKIVGESPVKDGFWPVHVDEETGALTVSDAVHHQIHLGQLFSVGYGAEGIADDGVVEILLQVPTTLDEAHIRIDGVAGGNAQFFLFEGTTFSAAGTSLTSINQNRKSANTALVTATHTPTITGDGTEIVSGYIVGGSGGNAQGGIAALFQEIALNPGDDYLLRLKNLAGTAQLLAISAHWYEIPD